MAEEQFGMRRDFLKEVAPWTKLFTAFKIALDPKKLVLGGCGVLVMALGWYVLSVVFINFNGKRPDWTAESYPDKSDANKREAAFKQFKRDRQRWYLMYELAGMPTIWELTVDGKTIYAPKDMDGIESLADLVNSAEEYDRYEKEPGGLRRFQYKPYGLLWRMPWFEDRGPNPYLLVTGKTRVIEAGATPAQTRLERFVDWLIFDELAVLLEPLAKFFIPIKYLFDPAAGFLIHIYLFLIILWSMATWAFFGGAITRIAAVQVARPNERVSLNEAVKFVVARYKAYLTAPLFPLVFLAFLAAVLFLFGLAEAWTFQFGDVLLTLLWPIVLLIGLVMAVVLVGLVGWPLMYCTISAEGSDSFDAISRSYSYVYQSPWNYIWYSFVALAYGAVVVFFVGFMGSLLVYMAKWAVTLPPTLASREPSYLFRYAPTSFGWRDLLLDKSPHAHRRIEVDYRGKPQEVVYLKVDKDYEPTVFNNIGAFFVAVWLYLFFLLIVGFGYSYFWTASTIIYLLMRKKVDDTEMDEIHVEEEPEQPFTSPVPSPQPGAEAPGAGHTTLQMVDSPQMKAPLAPTADASTSADPTKEMPRPDGSGPPGGAGAH